MSLRDCFAVVAMGALLIRNGCGWLVDEGGAQSAVDAADALIEALNKPKP